MCILSTPLSKRNSAPPCWWPKALCGLIVAVPAYCPFWARHHVAFKSYCKSKQGNAGLSFEAERSDLCSITAYRQASIINNFESLKGKSAFFLHDFFDGIVQQLMASAYASPQTVMYNNRRVLKCTLAWSLCVCSGETACSKPLI